MTARTVFALLLMSLLAGCQTIGGPKPTPVTVTPTVTTGAGITGGGLIGGAFGAKIASADRQVGLDAEYKALEYGKGGEVSTWASADGKTTGQIKAAQPYRVGSQDCRQYSHDLTTAAGTAKARATACRNADGSWTLLE